MTDYYVLEEIHPDDAFYDRKERYEGQIITLGPSHVTLKDPPIEDGWIYGVRVDFVTGGFISPESYAFWRIKVRRIDALEVYAAIAREVDSGLNNPTTQGEQHE